ISSLTAILAPLSLKMLEEDQLEWEQDIPPDVFIGDSLKCCCLCDCRYSKSCIYPVTEYSMSNRIALLINNINFCEPSLNRYGAEKDEEAMVYLLRTLRYEVVRRRDLTAQVLIHTDSVFVVLMSHGNLGIISGSDQKDFEIDQIYECLNTKNCPALLDKPKVIIIQACRGGDSHLPNIMFFPDTYSYRIEAYGSYFIHHIVNVFLSWCHEDDIEELFTKASLTVFFFFFFNLNLFVLFENIYRRLLLNRSRLTLLHS
uniref:Caspase family p20 domain-containing protein n=1 Tax=Amphilophus citrinellus TaxID=61819 RepID=A0A3Q0R7C0_AMPCI